MSGETGKPKKITIVIADDHPAVRRGIAAIIEDETDLEVVAEAANGAEAVEAFRQWQPDLLLMDLQMPVMNGVEATAALTAEFKTRARIIVLTTYDGDEDIYRSLRAGASGYLLKDAPIEDLLHTIRTVAAGKKSLQAEMAAKLADRVTDDELTGREREVLQLITQGKTNAQIGEELFIAETTVKYHLKNIFAKLGATDRTQAILIAIKRGLSRY